jgi:hypothetical protein
MLANPMPVKAKGQPLGAKAKKGLASSTKREPAAFESAVKKSQKCSNCDGINHSKRSCPQCSNQQPHALPILQDTPLLAPPKGVDWRTILVRLTNMPTDEDCGYHAVAHHLNKWAIMRHRGQLFGFCLRGYAPNHPPPS